MQWYEGLLPEAIAQAKRNNALFVVYIAGDDEESKKMDQTWLDESVGQTCQKAHCIALRIEAKSDVCQQFAQIYPVIVIPITFFIGNKGLPLEVIGGYLSPEDFKQRIGKVIKLHNDNLLDESPPAASPADIKAEQRTMSSDLPAASSPNAESGASSDFTEDGEFFTNDGSLEDKIDRPSRMRRDLTLAEQVKVLETLAAGKKQQQIAQEFGVSQSQISRISKRKDVILQQWSLNDNPNRKRARHCRLLIVDETLHSWYLNLKDNNIPVSYNSVIKKAKEIAESLRIPDGQILDWLTGWLEQRNIVLNGEEGECNISSEQTATPLVNSAPSSNSRSSSQNSFVDVSNTKTLNINTTCIKENVAKIVVVSSKDCSESDSQETDYLPDSIYYCDETAIYYQTLPKSLEPKLKNNNPILILLCTNLTGTHKLPPLVLGDQNLDYFQNGLHIPLPYVGVIDCMMTNDIFSDWLIQFDKEMGAKKRSVLMYLDNAPYHKTDIVLHNTILKYLPQNIAAAIHLMEDGLFWNIRVHYRRFALRRFLSEGALASRRISILDGLHLINSAWKLIGSHTISECFQKVGLLKQTQAPQVHSLSKSELFDSELPPGVSKEEFQEYLKADNELVMQLCFNHQFSNPLKLCLGLEDSLNKKLPSNTEALTSLGVVRQFLEMSGESNFSAFYEVENQIRQLIIKTKKTS